MAGFVDGALASARFRSPEGLLLSETLLYVADTGNHVVRAIDLSSGSVSTIAGTPATLGYFGDDGPATAALLYAPTAIARCPSGDLYVADTGNHRIRRIEAGSGNITTVLGDGVPASSGEGSPAWAFPVAEPRGLACDASGNLYVASSRTVRLLPADPDGVVDGSGPVLTIYGSSAEQGYPQNSTVSLTGLLGTGPDTLWLTDADTGLLLELRRARIAP
ncbi:MAG: hypothetical protein R2939_10525 [Kofleriaceae bacterium]